MNNFYTIDSIGAKMIRNPTIILPEKNISPAKVI